MPKRKLKVKTRKQKPYKFIADNDAYSSLKNVAEALNIPIFDCRKRLK